MPEYIERETVLNRIKTLQETDSATVGKKQFADGYFAGLDEAEIIAMQAPAADVVKIETLKSWLYKIAMNNIGAVIDGDFSSACEEIISRLDGLRIFAKETEDQQNA